jgi:hypothetical protein
VHTRLERFIRFMIEENRKRTAHEVDATYCLISINLGLSSVMEKSGCVIHTLIGIYPCILACNVCNSLEAGSIWISGQPDANLNLDDQALSL